MATLSNYKCNKCGKTFEAKIGGLMHATELRCVDCDNSEYRDVEIKEKICGKCGGKMVDNISSPMCPSCKSRDNKIEKVLMNLD